MPRIVLIHRHAGEAEKRAAALRRAGYEVACPRIEGGAELRPLADDPPDAFVIDLARLPSHGRDVGVFLRQRRASRNVPLVFAGGEPAKVSQARRVLPDAVYSSWEEVEGALARALASPPSDPVVPGAMTAYSGTPLPKKLGIKAGKAVALLGAPEGFEAALGDLPESVRIRRRAQGAADLVLLFAPSRAHLRRRFPGASRMLAEGGRLWIAWPKKASGLQSDLGEREVRAFGLKRGFVDFKIAAIDGTWSGLAFARRKGG